MKKSLITGLLALATGLNAQTVVNSDVTTDTTWSGTVILEGTIFVKGGAELTILPGTIVRGQPRTADGIAGSPGSLIVTQSGTINADGNVNNPIIFTTAAVDNDSNGIPDNNDDAAYLDGWSSGDTFYDSDPAGSPLGPLAAGAIPGSAAATTAGESANCELWGGIIILGSAPTNLGVAGNSTAKVGNIEGLPASADTQYGGNLPNDNSGVLRYVSVRHAGEQLGTDNELNGMTLGGVGYGTTMEYVEVYMNWDDGFEWFGGTVNGKYLVVSFAGDDQFDGDQGYTGQNQFLFATLPYFDIGSENGDEGLEFDGDDSDRNLDLSGVTTPFPNYTAYNLTIVGPAGATGQSNADCGRILLKSNYSGQIVNALVVQTGSVAGIDASGTSNPVVLDSVTFKNTGALALGGATTANVEDNPAGWAGLNGEDAATAGGLDPRPQAAFSGVASNIVVPNGYTQVSYRGAFDPAAPAGSLWVADWTALSLRGILVD